MLKNNKICYHFNSKVKNKMKFSPAKHQRPVARAKIIKKASKSITKIPTTIPIMYPASKSTPVKIYYLIIYLSVNVYY